MMVIALIPARDLPRVWPEVWPMLAPAVARSASKPDLLVPLTEQRADLWTVADDAKPVAAIVTTKQNDGRCLVWFIGGSRMHEWARQFLTTLAAAARAAGCWAIWGTGRKGWARVMPKLGFERIADHEGRPAWQWRIA
jgi:hypothetical protein